MAFKIPLKQFNYEIKIRELKSISKKNKRKEQENEISPRC